MQALFWPPPSGRSAREGQHVAPQRRGPYVAQGSRMMRQSHPLRSPSIGTMKPSTVRVAEVNAAAIARYKDMRGALIEGTDTNRVLCEIVITSQLGLLGHEGPFKIHAIRLFEQNVT